MSFWMAHILLFVHRHAAALTASPVAVFHHSPHQCGGLECKGNQFRLANHKATKGESAFYVPYIYRTVPYRTSPQN